MKRSNLPSFIRSLVLASTLATIGIAGAQPTITGTFPNGTYQFQYSPNLSFAANSPAGITNVSVQLTATTLQGQSSFKTLTPGNGLTVAGPATGETVSALLKSNYLYTAVIHVADATGASANSTVSFDTILPSYTWEAEDWDYTDTNSVSGLFFDNPQTNAYVNRATTDNVDAHNSNGGGAYRPSNAGGLSTEGCGDLTRVQYMGTGFSDYDVGFTDGGDFGNYTRHYPPGTYNIYMRGACGGGQSPNSAQIQVVSGSAVLSAVGTVSVPNIGGWQAYSWVPFKDGSGNLVTVTFDGSATTLQVPTVGGSYNANFYLLLPTNAVSSGGASDAGISGIYPDGTVQFQWTNTLSFSVTSTLGVNLSDIVVQLGATNLAGAGTSTLLTSGSGLTITGPSTNRSVTATLTSNTIYTASIQVTDANGNGAATNITFDTIIPAYTFEAEDWDYGTGQYVDNPQINAYAGVDGGVADVDQHCPDNVHSYAYRGGALAGFGLNNETAGDLPRPSNVGFQDYDVGFTSGGNWGNYTRHYPSGIFNIYVRASRGDGGTVSDAGSVAQVTSGYQTTSQSTSQIGTYNVSSTGNWQKYGWNAVRVAGNLARFTGDGSLKTLRVTIDSGGHNQNCFLLMPADLSQNPPPFVTGFQPDSSSLFQFTNTSSFVVNSSVGIASSNVTVNLDGVNVSALTFGGTSNLLTVSYPVKTNALHTAIITMADASGTTRYTNTFATYKDTDYQWEAEDFDYTNGLFFDAQYNAYNQLAGVSGVDYFESDPNAANGSFSYRPAPGIPTGNGDLGGELPRAQFTSGGGAATDYNIGYFGANSWANYTRHYPAGTYNVAIRAAEGNAPTEQILYRVTGGVGTASQTTVMLGTFNIPLSGWSSWKWSQLVDGSGTPVQITLTGAQTTLRLGGSLLGHDEANVNFLMLVPTIPVAQRMPLTASRSGGNISISFPTQSGFSYQLQYKNTVGAGSWTSLGSPIAGNGSVQSATDSIGGTPRVYRVQVQ